MIDKKKQGKSNRKKGNVFEKKVRADLENKGWIVSKWQNNVELMIKTKMPTVRLTGQTPTSFKVTVTTFDTPIGKIVPAKMGKFRSNQGGFPDYFAYRKTYQPEKNIDGIYTSVYEIIFVESKSNGKLSKEEKLKVQWYKDNSYCSLFWVAKKKKVGNKMGVKYKTI